MDFGAGPEEQGLLPLFKGNHMYLLSSESSFSKLTRPTKDLPPSQEKTNSRQAYVTAREELQHTERDLSSHFERKEEVNLKSKSAVHHGVCWVTNAGRISGHPGLDWCHPCVRPSHVEGHCFHRQQHRHLADLLGGYLDELRGAEHRSDAV